jgi:hypothetical protein
VLPGNMLHIECVSLIPWTVQVVVDKSIHLLTGHVLLAKRVGQGCKCWLFVAAVLFYGKFSFNCSPTVTVCTSHKPCSRVRMAYCKVVDSSCGPAVHTFNMNVTKSCGENLDGFLV